MHLARVALCLAIGGCAHFDPAAMKTYSVTASTPPEVAYHGLPLRAGQLIVSEQGTPISLFISLVGRRFYPFAHAGVIAIEGGEPYVYESVAAIGPALWKPPTDAASGAIRRTRLDAYVGRQRIVAIYDPPANVDRERVAAFARDGYTHHLRFDPYFDFDDHSAVYCSEFVALALEAGGYRQIDVTPVTANPSMQVVLDWLKIRSRGIVFAGSLVERSQPVALLSSALTPAQIRAYFAAKRELHRRFTDDQRLGNVFVWRFDGLHFRPEVRAFIDASTASAMGGSAGTVSIDVAVAALADRMLGRFDAPIGGLAHRD
jgi:hypothetical protein